MHSGNVTVYLSTAVHLAVPGSPTSVLDTKHVWYSIADHLLVPGSATLFVDTKHVRFFFIADCLVVPGPVTCHDDGHDVLLLAYLHVRATYSPQRDYEATHGA